ncbi:EamA family transporter [Roseomonas elaeocarpi]|uniref:EamA family transporter n=1 Tax=Roseomonas elaeocarpi TaxID=907779 RepID=A0ABV6JRF2_9PROT
MITSPFWLPATLGAAAFQSWRTALQQRLRGSMSVNAAGLVRYLYGAPTAAVLLAILLLVEGRGVPLPEELGWFFVWALLGGITQILGTNLLILSFGYRNFVVGTAYSKTDAMQGSVLGLLFLGEALRPLAWAGVAVSLVGVLVLSLTGKSTGLGGLLRAIGQPAALCGLGAGLGFAATGMFTKLTAATLPADTDALRRALTTLVAMNLLQSVMQGAWMLWREPAQLRAVFTGWRVALPVGVLSAMGSACWFTGFVLAPLGLVRAVGQVEILLTMTLGRFYLRESFTAAEVGGAVTVVAGVLLVLLGA